MHVWKAGWLLIPLTLLAIVSANAQTIGKGSSRQEVIAQFGEPMGTIKSGAEEVLTYQSVEVTLRDGRVTKLIRLNDRPLPTATVTGKTSQTKGGNDGSGAAPTNAAPAITTASTNQTASVYAKLTKPGWTVSRINGVVFLLLGAVLSIWGGISLLIQAYRVSVGWLLACLFLPLAQVVFVCLHWEEGGKPFLMSLAGGGALGLGVYLMVS